MPNQFRGHNKNIAGGFNQGQQMMQNLGMLMQPQGPKVKKEYDNSVCLYVGNLTPTTYDNDLYKFFKSKGYKLRNGQVMIDRETKKSKCFGYLNFYSQEEAQRCLDNMNNATLNGKQIVLNKKKDSDWDTNANVLVKNMPKDITQQGLFDMFKEFGKIVSCKIETAKEGASKGYGYVQFDNKDSAQTAITKMNNFKCGDKELQVLIHSKKDQRGDTGEHFTNLFVKNIPTNFTDDQLGDLFKEFGEIQSAKVKGSGSDCGFVMFKTHEQAQAAVDALNAKKEVEGKIIFVGKFISAHDNQKNQDEGKIDQQMKETFKSNIYVRNIPKEITEEEFKEKMGEAGKIISVRLKDMVQNIDGESYIKNKTGYVCFEKVDEAQKCIKLFDESHKFGWGGNALKVDFWQSKYDLKHETEEKNINQVKKFIKFIQQDMQDQQHKSNP